ncbi:MAG: hypothetical protein RJS98_00385 [Rhodospirillaceae bacterium]
MSLKGLKLAEDVRGAKLPPNMQARAKFMERLDEQIAMSQQHIEGKEFARIIKRKQADPETGEMKVVEHTRPVKPWWFKHADGLQYVELKYGSAKLSLNQNKPLIEAGRDLKDVKQVLGTIRTATEKGELDDILVAAKSKRKPPTPANQDKPKA